MPRPAGQRNRKHFQLDVQTPGREVPDLARAHRRRDAWQIAARQQLRQPDWWLRVRPCETPDCRPPD